MRQLLASAVPRSAMDTYRKVRKRFDRDVHVRLDRNAVSHLYRYVHADGHLAGAEVLDAACGSGYGALALSSAASYHGVDLDPTAIAEARSEFPEFRYSKGSVYQLPFDEGRFDAVVSFETLEHVQEPHRAMAEYARVLRVGGRLIGSIPIDHPDRIYHVKPYSAAEALDIFSSCARLRVDMIHRQGDTTVVPWNGTTDQWSGGTMLVHLSRV